MESSRERCPMKEVVTTELEVRWGECDPAGIVYHPSYIDWFSVARMRFLYENDVPYMTMFHDNGVVLVVLEVQCRYVKTLRPEQRIAVTARVRRLSRTRMGLDYEVRDDKGDLCASGLTEHAFVDLDNRPVNVAKRSPALWRRLQQVPVHE